MAGTHFTYVLLRLGILPPSCDRPNYYDRHLLSNVQPYPSKMRSTVIWVLAGALGIRAQGPELPRSLTLTALVGKNSVSALE
jgi:hypothetical protein